METPNTPNWQISISDPTVTLADVEDIAQSIYLILSTVKGSDPMRPAFGSDVYTYLDQPINTVAPMLVYEVFDAIGKWEKRLNVTKVNVTQWSFDKKNIEIKGITTVPTAEVVINYSL